MTRQHTSPILLAPEGAKVLTPVPQHGGDWAVSEADIQALVHNHPGSLPIAEIDPMFARAIAICRELNTPAGAIDNLLLTPSGLPVLVECKLWRNPQGRREVVGQILDYAKELSRWTSSDLQREVSRRIGGGDNPLLDLVRAADPSVDEIHFNDALTANLRRGRFLLLILGDGIREGVEAIAEYLQAHAGLHFSLGLVEFPIYQLPDGNHLVAPRVLARTTLITRTVIALPDGVRLEEVGDGQAGADAESVVDPDRAALGDAQQAFWREFLEVLHLDDPEQARPKPARQGYITLGMPAPGYSSWLTVYRDMRNGQVGIFLSAERNTSGERAAQAIIEDWDRVRPQLGGTVRLDTDRYGRQRIIDTLNTGSLDDPEVRVTAFGWLAERVNSFVNVLRPLVRAAAIDARQEA